MDIILILVLAFVFRLIFSLSESDDDHVHFWNIKLRKKLGSLWSHDVPDSLLDGKRGYPPLEHYLISLFPERWWSLAGRFLNISYDCFSILIVYFLSAYLFAEKAEAFREKYIFTPQAVIALLLATSPILMPTTARMRSLGARSLGTFLTLIFLIFLGYGIIYNPFVGLGACILLGIIIILGSQFALQNMVFISIILALLYLNYIPVLALGIIGLIAWIFSRLGARDILAFKYEHAKWYRRNWAKGTTASRRNLVSEHLMLPVYLVKNLSKFVLIVFQESSYIIASYSVMPLILCILILIQFRGQHWAMGNPEVQYASYITLASLIVFILTSLKPLLFLGQAERYFEYSVPFILFLFVHLVFVNNLSSNWLYFTVLFQIIFSLLNFLVTNLSNIRTSLYNTLGPELEEIILELKKHSNMNILTVPTKLSFKLAFYFEDQHRFYYRAINEKKRGFAYKEEDEAWFGLPSPDFDHFKSNYNVNTIVMDKSILGHAEEKNVNYDITKLEKVFENNKYIILTL